MSIARGQALRAEAAQFEAGKPPSGATANPLSAASAAQAALAQAVEQLAKVDAGLPADDAEVSIRLGPQVSDASVVEAWKAQLRRQLGPGDAQALEAGLERYAPAMLQLAQVYSGRRDPEALAPSSDLLKAAVASLTQQYGLEVKLLIPDVAPDVGGSTAPLLLAVKTAGEVKYFAVNPRLITERLQSKVVFAAIREAGLTEAVYAALKKSPRAQDFDEGDASSTLRALESLSGTALVAEAFAGLSPQAGATLLQKLAAKGAPVVEQLPVAPAAMVLAVDAAELLKPSPERVAGTTSLSAFTDLDKAWHHFDQHYDAMVAPVMGAHLVRGGGRTLQGTALANEVGAALHLAPDHVPQTPRDWAAAEAGDWPFFTGQSQEVVGPVVQAISALGGPPPRVDPTLPLALQRQLQGSTTPRVTVLPVVFDSKQLGSVQLPLFRVEGPAGLAFVDNLGRTYSSLEDWRQNNKLPPGRVSYPKDGNLTEGTDGAAPFVTEATHAVVDTAGEHVVQVLDTAALVGGIALGVAAAVGTGGALVPIAGGAFCAWSTYRAGSGLVDRATHRQTLDPFQSAEARGQWLSLGSGVLGLTSLGGPLAASLLNGTRAASSLSAMSTAASWAGRGVDALGIADFSHTLATQWHQLPATERLMMLSQLAFWVGGTVKGVREAGGLESYVTGRDLRPPPGVKAPSQPLLSAALSDGPLEPDQALTALNRKWLSKMIETHRQAGKLEAVVDQGVAELRDLKARLSGELELLTGFQGLMQSGGVTVETSGQYYRLSADGHQATIPAVFRDPRKALERHLSSLKTSLRAVDATELSLVQKVLQNGTQVEVTPSGALAVLPGDSTYLNRLAKSVGARLGVKLEYDPQWLARNHAAGFYSSYEKRIGLSRAQMLDARAPDFVTLHELMHAGFDRSAPRRFSGELRQYDNPFKGHIEVFEGALPSMPAAYGRGFYFDEVGTWGLNARTALRDFRRQIGQPEWQLDQALNHAFHQVDGAKRMAKTTVRVAEDILVQLSNPQVVAWLEQGEYPKYYWLKVELDGLPVDVALPRESGGVAALERRVRWLLATANETLAYAHTAESYLLENMDRYSTPEAMRELDEVLALGRRRTAQSSLIEGERWAPPDAEQSE